MKNIIVVDDMFRRLDKERIKNGLESHLGGNAKVDFVDEISNDIIERVERYDLPILDIEMRNENRDIQNAIVEPLEKIINNKGEYMRVLEKIQDTERQLEDMGIEYVKNKVKSKFNENLSSWVWIQNTIHCLKGEDYDKDYHGDIDLYFGCFSGEVDERFLDFPRRNNYWAKRLSGLGISKILKEKGKSYNLYTTGLVAHDPMWLTYGLALDVISPEEITGVVQEMLKDPKTQLEDWGSGVKIVAPEDRVYKNGRLAVINTRNNEIKAEGLQQLLQGIEKIIKRR